MRHKKKIKFNKCKIGIIFLVFSMLIGFAALNTKLNFLGHTTLSYSNSDFRVYFSRTFLNGIGMSKLISEDKKNISFTYSDIQRKNADLKYTVKNTSDLYYADVDVKCKAKKNDGTKFLYGEDNYISQKIRINPGQSVTSNLQVLVPENSEINPISSVENVNLESYIRNLSKGSDSNINFDSLNESGVYESSNTDSTNPVYYYRGNTVDNYVIFAERCWQILRTSENGGIKLIYGGFPNGNSCLTEGAFLGIQDETIEFNSLDKYNNNAYAGYMYGSLNASNYENAHSNTKNSVFKTKIDEWYERNILNTTYEQYLIDDVYYNDRTLLTDYTNVNSTLEYSGLGYGTHSSLYNSASRVSLLSNKLSPTFKTIRNDDRFSVSNTIGNGALKYPVSTLTADELVYAGTTKSGGNSWLFLYGRMLFTMSPIGYYDDSMNFIIQNSDGHLDSIPKSSDTPMYVLPTITISNELNILSGNGSHAHPFILSSENVYENSYTCSLNVEEIGYKEGIKPQNVLVDLEPGDEYCFQDECFYTISNDKKGTIKLLAKYNLYVGRIYNNGSDYTTISEADPLYGKQHYTALATLLDPDHYPRVGTIPYSSSQNDNTYDNSVVKPYVDAYGEYLKEITGINIKASLITKDELISLGCVSSNGVSNCNKPNYDWVTSSTYWTMTPGNNTVYLVGADGYFNAPTSTANLTNTNLRGIRPVITISYSGVNPDVTFVTGNGENVGDELCIGEECFYVLNYDGDNYTLFAKYNLYVGKKTGGTISETDPLYGKQNALAIGDKGSPIYGTMDYPNALPAVNNYVDYLKNTFNINISSGRLIKPSELAALGCDENRYATDTSAYKNWGCEYPAYAKYSWILNSTYWVESTSSNIYLVGGDGFYKPLASTSGTNSDNRGARPVIVVPASQIKDPNYLGPSSYPSSWNDKGIFKDYYDKAYKKLKTMTTSEKVGQLLVMSYNESNANDAVKAVQNYHVGGVLFFANAFTDKSVEDVQSMTSNLQTKSKIPLIMPVDEEGGIVTRIASNTNLVQDEMNNYPNLFKKYTRYSQTFNSFKSPSDLYVDSGNNFNLIRQETVVKDQVLKKLGLNVNFAPVLDISDSNGYIYERTLKQNAEITGEYAKNIIESSKEVPGVSNAFKHFPGYGNNVDTHTGSATDNTSLADLKIKNMYPFEQAINAGAQAIMINHNVYTSIDSNYPASISPAMHDYLFDNLKFTGIAITDDLSMDAIGQNYPNQYLKAFQAGNHILLASTDYISAYDEILAAVNNNTISMDELNERVFKVLAWKYYLGLIQ